MTGTQQLRGGRLGNLHVLVAEDEWLAADTLSVFLEEEGAHVVGPCARVSSALELVSDQRVDFAVIDMRLVDDFADALIDELIGRKIPYIILTAFETLPTDADASAVAVLHKPISKKALIDRMIQHQHRLQPPRN